MLKSLIVSAIGERENYYNTPRVIHFNWIVRSKLRALFIECRILLSIVTSVVKYSSRSWRNLIRRGVCEPRHSSIQISRNQSCLRTPVRYIPRYHREDDNRSNLRVLSSTDVILLRIPGRRTIRLYLRLSQTRNETRNFPM